MFLCTEHWFLLLKGSHPLPIWALLTGHCTVSDTLSGPWNFFFICYSLLVKNPFNYSQKWCHINYIWKVLKTVFTRRNATIPWKLKGHSVTFQSPFSRLNGRYISVTIQWPFSAIQSPFRRHSVIFNFFFFRI